jgi:hypothetical protein
MPRASAARGGSTRPAHAMPVHYRPRMPHGPYPATLLRPNVAAAPFDGVVLLPAVAVQVARTMVAAHHLVADMRRHGADDWADELERALSGGTV